MTATPAKVYQRRYRRRKRLGRRVYTVEAETASVCDLLEREGYLTFFETDDPAKIEAALKQWIDDCLFDV